MLVGITGKAGSGKDTVADIFLKKEKTFTKYSFARPIYDLAEAWLGLTEGYYHRDIKESQIAIDVNSDIFPCLDILIYDMFKDKHDLITPASAKETAKVIVDNLIKDSVYHHRGDDKVMLITSPRRILQIIGTEGFRDTVIDSFWLDIAPDYDTIIPDVRFENEAEFIRANGVLIHLSRDHENIAESTHSSENGVTFDNSVDHMISNTGDLEQLCCKVQEFYEEYF